MHILQQLLHYGTGAPHPAGTNRSHSDGTEDAEMGRFAPTDAGSGVSTGNYQSTGMHGGLNERRVPHSEHGAEPPIHPAAQGLFDSLAAEPEVLKMGHGDEDEDDDEAHGGHDSPNWSKGKSATVLLGCTVLYSIIAGKYLPAQVLYFYIFNQTRLTSFLVFVHAS